MVKLVANYSFYFLIRKLEFVLKVVDFIEKTLVWLFIKVIIDYLKKKKRVHRPTEGRTMQSVLLVHYSTV